MDGYSGKEKTAVQSEKCSGGVAVLHILVSVCLFVLVISPFCFHSVLTCLFYIFCVLAFKTTERTAPNYNGENKESAWPLEKVQRLDLNGPLDSFLHRW